MKIVPIVLAISTTFIATLLLFYVASPQYSLRKHKQARIQEIPSGKNFVLAVNYGKSNQQCVTLSEYSDGWYFWLENCFGDWVGKIEKQLFRLDILGLTRVAIYLPSYRYRGYNPYPSYGYISMARRPQYKWSQTGKVGFSSIMNRQQLPHDDSTLFRWALNYDIVDGQKVVYITQHDPAGAIFGVRSLLAHIKPGESLQLKDWPVTPVGGYEKFTPICCFD